MNLGWRWAAIKNGFQDALAYRAEFIIEILGAAIVPVSIQLVLWYSLFKIGGAQEIAGMSYQQMIHYTLMSALFSQVRGGDNDFELAEMIRNGQLSNYLLRPVGVVEFVYLRGVAPRLLVSAICFTVGASVGAFLGFSVVHIFGAMLMALLGNMIHYQIGAALASVSFYWEESYSVLMVKNLVVSLLSGELIPLTLFPEQYSWVWKSFPFYLYVFGPAQYALGQWSHTEYLMNMGIGLIWLIVGALAIRLSWGLGVKHYSSLGG